jgi:hypothetical protein
MDMTYGLTVCEVVMLVIGSVFSQIFRSVIGDVNWNPSYIFYGGEPGVWYDPSDLTTLFQDSAGTTPVTAAGQTVGLMLDKSKGLAPGSELVTNGDFSGGATGWSAGPTPPTGWTFADGTCSGLAATGGYQNIGQIVSGRSYVAEFTISNYVNGLVSLSSSAVGGFGSQFSGNGVKRQIFTATATGTVGFVRRTTNFTGTLDNISVKELPGNHATQATLAQRPTYQVDGSGYAYLSFDGSVSGMVTNTITPGIDKVQVFAGVRKLSDAAEAVMLEMNTTYDTGNGAFALFAPGGISVARDSAFVWASKGTLKSFSGPVAAAFPAPITNVLACIGDIAGDASILRVNSVQVSQSTADQGTGNYLAYPLYIGRRGGTTQPFNGRLYSLIVRFGANLAANQITSAENWVNSKTGAY